MRCTQHVQITMLYMHIHVHALFITCTILTHIHTDTHSTHHTHTHARARPHTHTHTHTQHTHSLIGTNAHNTCLVPSPLLQGYRGSSDLRYVQWLVECLIVCVVLEERLVHINCNRVEVNRI